MKAIAGDLPVDDAGWAYEIKWDGMRVLAFVGADGSVRLQSANLLDISESFPELAGLGAATAGRTAVLDGEVVAFDESGRPSFERLQQRMHVRGTREVASRAAAVPVLFHLFDLLAFDGIDATELAYRDRRRLLETVIDDGPSWAVPASYPDGRELLRTVDELGLEGVMAKRADSRYQPGRRSPAWRKIKVRRHQELVVGGWAPGEGRRTGRPGSFLLGYRAEDRWRYAGRVGTGFTDAELDRLASLLQPADLSPFDPLPPPRHRGDAHWVIPTLVVEVAFSNWTDEGMLRHPSYLGQRLDKDPLDVTREP